MTTYVDSSVLVAVYVPERFSKAARRVVGGTPQVPFTWLHELEVANAFGMLLGRGLISSAEHRAIHAHLQEDLESQRLRRLPLDWDRVFAKACDLSVAHTVQQLTRSLDLLHVAAAHTAACHSFVSADDRQLAVAKAAGLAITDIKRRVPRIKRWSRS